MKKIVYALLVVVLLLAAGLSCSQPAPAPAPTPAPAPSPAPAPAPAPAPVTIKMLSFTPKTNAMSTPVMLFQQRIEAESKGRIKMDWPGGPEVIPSFDQPEALKNGVIDAQVYTPGMYMASFMPEVFAAGLSPYTSWEERTNGVFDMWSNLVATKMNAKYMGRFENAIPGFYLYTKDKPVHSLSDFKGLTMRAAQLYVPIMEQLGIAPVVMEAGDMYDALSHGVIDGVMQVPFAVVPFGIHELLKYRIEPGLFQVDNFAMINMDFWNKLPKEDQDILNKVCMDMEYIGTATLWRRLAGEWDIAQAAGMSPSALNAADAKQFTTIARNVIWEKVKASAPDNYAMLQEKLNPK